MKINTERKVIFSILLLSVISFFSFGLFHLGKFETTDEHLWKYDRIGKYWNALAEKDWSATYINDKPGVTVALISGIGMFAEPHPELNEKFALSNSVDSKLYEQYNYTQTALTNFRFRLPVLIFSTLSLLAFFYLTHKAFQSLWVALIATLFIATNPILLGISQIINPDSFFWIFGGLSALSYLALIKTRSFKFLLICGILTGFALLSKYTAFILFLFFGIVVLAKIIFQKPEKARELTWKNIFQYVLEIVVIFIISIVIFSVFLPAVFLHPEYLFKGISQFLNLKTILAGVGLLALLTAIIIFQKNIIGKIAEFISKKDSAITILTTSLFSLLLIISLFNVWTGQRLAPVDELRDLAYANEPKEFSFKPLIDKRAVSPLNQAQFYLMEIYPLIFSLSPLFILLFFAANFLALRKKLSHQGMFIINTITIFILLYIFSTIHAKIVTNVRYSIILYPLLAVFSAIALKEVLNFLQIKKQTHLVLVALFIFILGLFSFYSIKPFYFSYTNFFLPKDFSIHDSWGHGSYEAALHLNSLPDAKNLVIWSNSDTVCRFFEGKCLRSRNIDLNIAEPDYFVISKRGVLKEKNHFILNNNPHKEKNNAYYFEKLDSDYEWAININNRPDNFVKIIKFE